MICNDSCCYAYNTKKGGGGSSSALEQLSRTLGLSEQEKGEKKSREEVPLRGPYLITILQKQLRVKIWIFHLLLTDSKKSGGKMPFLAITSLSNISFLMML